MIKQKEVYSLDDDNSFRYRKFPSDTSVTISLIRQTLSEIIKRDFVNCVISDDEYKYKTGVFKSETVPCIVLSHAEKPKDYKKFVIFIRPEGTYLVAENVWYGESKLDKLTEKIDKSEAKIHRAANNPNLSTEGFVTSLGRMAANKSRNKKADQLVEIEYRYYSEIVNAVDSMYSSFEG